MGLWAVGVEGSRKVPGKAWYRIKPEGLIKELNSSVDGLSETEAQERVKFYGLNELKTEDGTRIGRILARQVLDVMVLILAAAAVIAWATGDPTDTAMILLIVVLNVTLGFSQEYRAEKALDALKKLEEPHVLIKRGGQIRRIASRFLVPGDMMAIEGGNRIPADGRLVEAVHLRMDESHLTGESVGVEKGTETLANPDLPLGDRTNLVFAGTIGFRRRLCAFPFRRARQPSTVHRKVWTP